MDCQLVKEDERPLALPLPARVLAAAFEDARDLVEPASLTLSAAAPAPTISPPQRESSSLAIGSRSDKD